ncbi:hypothetical protein U1Q18_003018 [Sarracenia purpurea var. burkii]
MKENGVLQSSACDRKRESLDGRERERRMGVGWFTLTVNGGLESNGGDGRRRVDARWSGAAADGDGDVVVGDGRSAVGRQRRRLGTTAGGVRGVSPFFSLLHLLLPKIFPKPLYRFPPFVFLDGEQRR